MKLHKGNHPLASRECTKDAHPNKVDVTTEIIREWETTGRCDKHSHPAVWPLTRVDTWAMGQNSLRLLISRDLECLNKHTHPVPSCLCECVSVCMCRKQTCAKCNLGKRLGIRIWYHSLTFVYTQSMIVLNMLKCSSPHLSVAFRVTVQAYADMLPWCLTQPFPVSSACPERRHWQWRCPAESWSFPAHCPASPDHVLRSEHNYHTLEDKQGLD